MPNDITSVTKQIRGGQQLPPRLQQAVASGRLNQHQAMQRFRQFQAGNLPGQQGKKRPGDRNNGGGERQANSSTSYDPSIKSEGRPMGPPGGPPPSPEMMQGSPAFSAAIDTLRGGGGGSPFSGSVHAMPMMDPQSRIMGAKDMLGTAVNNAMQGGSGGIGGGPAPWSMGRSVPAQPEPPQPPPSANTGIVPPGQAGDMPPGLPAGTMQRDDLNNRRPQIRPGSMDRPSGNW